jgi:hypothetical protein
MLEISMIEQFYKIAEELDELKKVSEPTDANINKLVQYLDKVEYAHYFFNNLENPSWVMPLYKLGLFYKVPPPLEDKTQPGYFSMPVWHEGEYLRRMADKFPDIVKEVALSLITDNSRAILTMFEALLRIPANFTVETVNQFKRWVDTPYANFMMLANELGIIMGYLAKEGHVDSALEVLDILLEPIQIKDRFEETKLIASSHHELYWLNETLQNNLPVLIEIEPIGVLNVGEKNLIKAIDLEFDPKINDKSKITRSYWRLNISPKIDTIYDRDLKNLLVNIIIQALDKASEQKQDKVQQIIGQYIDNTYSIFRRIGEYTLRAWGEQYPEMLERAYLRQRKEPIIGWSSEVNRLLEIQYKNLSDHAKKEILDERKNPDPKRVDDFLLNYPDRVSGSTNDEKKQTLIEKWQLDGLMPIGAYLEGEEKGYFEKLLKKYGEPTPRTEDGLVVTSWEGPQSPIEQDELSKKSIAEVVQYLQNYVPSSGDSFGLPSREGLGRIFEADVQARANDYAKNAILFIDDNLPFVYHTHYLRGLEIAIKNKGEIELIDVITLCEFIVDKEKDQFPKQEFEEGLQAAKFAVANFFEEIFKIKETDLEDDLIEKSGKLIVSILGQEEPFPDNEAATGYDPAMHSLNSLHGMAMHCIVSYGLYCQRKRKKEMGDEGKPIMVPLVKEMLTKKMDKKNDPSLAVHAVLGWYFPQFIYLDKDWALENREKIFPIGTGMAKYWQAAWSAYIQFSDVYTNVFPSLLVQYKRALNELPNEDKKQGFDRSNEQMASHILKAYLLDMIKLDSEDGLMNLFYQKANDDTRSQGVFWLSQVLGGQKPSEQDELWKKIWDLWQWRIQKATESDDQSGYTNEIPNFMRLLKNVPLELPEIYSILQKTLNFKTKGFEIQQLIEYLGEKCDKHPDLAVSLLHEIVRSGQEFYLLDDTKKSVEKILSSASHSDSETKSNAVDIINIFGERGDYSWRSYLENLQ